LRRRKNQRTSTTLVASTTSRPGYFAGGAGDRSLWGLDHHRHQQQLDREGAAMSRLEQLIAQIRTKLTMNRDLVTQMPSSLCATLSSGERRCWNGTNYSRSVLQI